MNKRFDPFRFRLGSSMLIALFMLCTGAVVRIVLLSMTIGEVDLNPITLAKVFSVGAFYDLVTYFYLAAPVAILVLITPQWWIRSSLNRWYGMIVYGLVIFIILFNAIAELVFWEEFGVRFNFIAVDYLVYTSEVLQNIWESYPILILVPMILFVATVITLFTAKWAIRCFDPIDTKKQRLAFGVVYASVPLLAMFFLTSSPTEVSTNRYMNELAKNGTYSLFEAFWANTIDFNQFYITYDPSKIDPRLREMLATDNSRFLSDDLLNLTRQITYPGPPTLHNVIIVTVESLSAQFMGIFGNADGLTPNLDSLSQDSLNFTHFYATGTRTVRGLEAITLSLPPTPGRSLIKRPHNENLFSLGFIMRDHGYDTKFIYGGYGYFDNMNYFFSHNGFEAIDRMSLPDSDIHFSNAWGVCDEDLFDLVITEADKSAEKGLPFLSLVMTTSNHRPYTYPKNRIDIPSGTGRSGAVKYTDYAIGRFIRQCREKPWFDQTIFVIVADHCASSAGKTEVPINNYKIPCIIYAPGFIDSGSVDTAASQIDLAPTLLGLLNISYTSQFFGKDLLNHSPNRALVGTYQKLGLFAEGQLAVLGPNKESRDYRIDPSGVQTLSQINNQMLLDDVCYYQTASYLIDHHLYKRQALTEAVAPLHTSVLTKSHP